MTMPASSGLVRADRVDRDRDARQRHRLVVAEFSKPTRVCIRERRHLHQAHRESSWRSLRHAAAENAHPGGTHRSSAQARAARERARVDRRSDLIAVHAARHSLWTLRTDGTHGTLRPLRTLGTLRSCATGWPTWACGPNRACGADGTSHALRTRRTRGTDRAGRTRFTRCTLGTLRTHRTGWTLWTCDTCWTHRTDW